MPADEQQSRDQSLREELANVEKVNQAIEGVIESLGRARENMQVRLQRILNNPPTTDQFQVVNQTVIAASKLLSTWSRILSQTEHNQRLILDPDWHGASRDLEDIEAEAIQKQHAADRKEMEEQERRAAAALRAEEEDERRRTETIMKSSKVPGRGRGLPSSRAGSVNRPVSTGYVASSTSVGTNNTVRGSGTSQRRASGVSRGSSYRGRGRIT